MTAMTRQSWQNWRGSRIVGTPGYVRADCAAPGFANAETGPAQVRGAGGKPRSEPWEHA